ncbi:MAG TPA: hypothetical protein VFK01_05120 [Bradyrhizobium sp.]|jgi:hypothetical protein|nr:hypothetical protein [Bradyrhizobium sp.]
MENRPTNQFGKRRPSTIAPTEAHPVKRSRHVALLLTGTLAVGGVAYAMMERGNCEPKGPGMAGPSQPQSSDCRAGGSSSRVGYGGSGGSWSRSNLSGGDQASARSSGGTSSESGSGEATRGGFGSFARSLGLHFSGT